MPMHPHSIHHHLLFLEYYRATTHLYYRSTCIDSAVSTTFLPAISTTFLPAISHQVFPPCFRQIPSSPPSSIHPTSNNQPSPPINHQPSHPSIIHSAPRCSSWSHEVAFRNTSRPQKDSSSALCNIVVSILLMLLHGVSALRRRSPHRCHCRRRHFDCITDIAGSIGRSVHGATTKTMSISSINATIWSDVEVESAVRNTGREP